MFTQEGRNVHRRVDKLDHVLPDSREDSTDQEHSEDQSECDSPPIISRSIPLGSYALQLTAKLDLVSTANGEAVPVEIKRGRVPENEQRSWEPERVQLMAQGMLLREHGYRCNHGVLYYSGSRTRVNIFFTDKLETRTRELITLARQASLSDKIPLPLDDSPKCPGCSLAGICLPDETRQLTSSPSVGTVDVRRLFPIRDVALPFYVQEQGSRVGKHGRGLVIRKGNEKLASVRIKDVSQLVLCGSISVSAQALNWLCQEGIPIVHLTTGHWFCGLTTGITLRNAFARVAQYRVADTNEACLSFSRAIVAAKGSNQRTMLRRNATRISDTVLDQMAELLRRIPAAPACEYLLGLEGNLAAQYFGNFSKLISPKNIDVDWDFTSRNRRPPKDPVNAMLSFGYALLSKECTVALLAEGLDPWWGLYHKPRHGRPALALDLMEEFRTLVVDSAVVTAINTGMMSDRSFQRSHAGCLLTDNGRKTFIRAYEMRLDQLVTHPVFDYRCSWRSIIRLQARLLSRWIIGELPEYTGMTTR